ncbi:hypothetical protein HN873_011718, partial [Arachis hypogaea]
QLESYSHVSNPPIYQQKKTIPFDPNSSILHGSKKKGGLKMRDLKTYLSVAPVVSTLWFGALAGLLIEINRFFPDALIFPFF